MSEDVELILSRLDSKCKEEESDVNSLDVVSNEESLDLDADDEEDNDPDRCEFDFDSVLDKPMLEKTTTVNGWIFIGSTILARWKNGLYYLGFIEQVDLLANRCLIKYEDGSLYWSHFKDLHKQVSVGSIMSDSDILCAMCGDGSSKAPDEIVICDVCNQGYHQLCHKPVIPNSVLKPDAPWSCRKCVFALGTGEGGAVNSGPVAEAMRTMKTVLPYDINSLTWDGNHFVNRENTYCYCGGPGEYHSKMLQCNSCHQWFHEACIQVLSSPMLYGDHYYLYTCAICNRGRETVKRKIMKWSDMVGLVLYNLSLNEDRTYFDVNSDIVPFIQKNCNKLKLNVDLNKMKEKELYERVISLLKIHVDKFKLQREQKGRSSQWGLRIRNRSRTALIFAPPLAITGNSSSSNDNTGLHATNLPPGAAMMSASPSKSPVPYPLVYGACRKGASVHPKPCTKSKLLSENAESICSNGSSASSSNNSSGPGRKAVKTFDSRKKIGSPTRMKAKSNSSVTSDGSDVECTSLSFTLDNFIPRPQNFEGTNNPFYDLDKKPVKSRQTKRKKAKTSDEDYRVVQSYSTSSKLTIQRVSPAGGNKLASASEDALTNESVKCIPGVEERLARGHKYTVLARRLTKDGKLEYLLEWDSTTAD